MFWLVFIAMAFVGLVYSIVAYELRRRDNDTLEEALWLSLTQNKLEEDE